MHGSRKFCQNARGGKHLITFFCCCFFGWWGERGSKYRYKWWIGWVIIGPPAFCWQADNGPISNAGLVALLFLRGSGPVLQSNPIFLWFLRGGGRTPCPASGHDKGKVSVCEAHEDRIEEAYRKWKRRIFEHVFSDFYWAGWLRHSLCIRKMHESQHLCFLDIFELTMS